MLLDEPTEETCADRVEGSGAQGIIHEVRHVGHVVEQQAQKILRVTDNDLILDRGSIVHASSSRALIDDPTPLEQHLGVTDQKRGKHLHRAHVSEGPFGSTAGPPSSM
jgi:branched-chain amino acid transport system ATP-binding protein